MDFERSLLNFKDIKQRLQYAATLPEKLVLEICSKNTELNQTVCLNEDYWKIRYLKNNTAPTTEPKSWKELHIFPDISNVWSFGHNSRGQLGLGDNKKRNIPTKIQFDIKAKQIDCGEYHSMIIDIDSNVWSFGYNDIGPLGLGVGTDRNKPTQIPNIKAKQIAGSFHHSMIIDTNDNVWTFGNNDFGQLGLGDYNNINKPTQISEIKAKQIACGEYHSIIIDTDSKAMSFGKNEDGQLGLGDNGEDTERNKPTQIPNIKAKQIACGENHSMIIDMNGNVWSFGSNHYGQLGLGNNGQDADRNKPTQIQIPSGIKAAQIVCGRNHSMIIDANDDVWSFGDNGIGQLGLGDYNNINKPTQIQNIKAKQIACGDNHSMIIDMNDNVWSFGNNYFGQLGLGNNGEETERNKPTQIQNIKATQIACGRFHSLILTNIQQLLPFDEITNMFSQGQVTNFEIEHNLQIPHKALQGIYVGTFTDKEGQKKYGYIRYNQETNQITKP